MNGRSSRHAASGSRPRRPAPSCSSVVGEIQDREIERLVRQPRQPLGHGLDLEDEAFAVQRADDARPLDAVAERDEETLLPAARSVAKNLQRLARAIGVYHLAARLYRETPRAPSPSISGVVRSTADAVGSSAV